MKSDKKAHKKGRINAVLADKVEVVVSGDYRADHAALSEEHLKMLAKENIYVSMLPLNDPIVMRLAVDGYDDAMTITAHSKARISTTLSTLEGPFRLRNVEYLVFKEPMNEVLLSRPVLQTLGFDLDQHLLRVRAKYNDVDMTGISFEPESGLPDNEIEPA